MLEYQNIKTFFQKAMSQIGLKKFLWLQNLKTQCRGTYIISDLKGEEIVETFLRKRIAKNKSKRVQSWKSNKEKRR